MTDLGCVIDASALLAALYEEPGADIVAERLAAAAITAVNWCEVVERSTADEASAVELRESLEQDGLTIIPFSAALAHRAARLWEPTRGLGLSLADRACLALAAELDLPVVTSDRAWTELDLGLTIEAIC